MKDDSIEGIYDTLKQTAKISQSAGGIGLSIHNIRATGSYISGTNGTSNGIIPMLRVFNDTARYVDQGGGKRKGAGRKPEGKAPYLVTLTKDNVEQAKDRETNFSGLLDRLLARWLGKS